MAEPTLSQAILAMNSALRAGDIAAIATLSQSLEESLVTAQSAMPHPLSELRALRRLAQENQLLLDAVGRGLRQASQRLIEIGNTRRGLRTYGPGGTSRAWLDQTGQGKRF